MFCGNCGSKVDDGLKFCSNCGFNISDMKVDVANDKNFDVFDNSANSNGVQPATGRKNSFMRVLFFVILVVFVIVVGFIFFKSICDSRSALLDSMDESKFYTGYEIDTK